MGPVESLGIEEPSMAKEPSPRSPFSEQHERSADPMPALSLRTFALSAVAALAATNPALNRDSSEWLYVAEFLKQVPSEKSPWLQAVMAALQEPAREDRAVVHLAAVLSCTVVEVLTVVLAAAVDEDLMVGRALAFLQAPVGGARPTLGLLAAAYADLAEPGRRVLDVLLTGSAIRSGLLLLGGEDGPLPERAVSVSQTVGLALRGHDGLWPGTTIGIGAESVVALPPSVHESAVQYARSVTAAAHQSLLIRSGFLAEAKSSAAAMA
ncbi:MAG: hypothetical protein Q7U76_08260, partial [Nitrospirota bacterium]|nr:hypothetical protein [Nitrospirota bacterium]